jgi:anthranilate phosphoribosyltransferase
MGKKEILQKLMEKHDLTIEESEFLFTDIFNGVLTDIEIASFLTALKVKGESPDEIAGAINILNRKKIKVEKSVEFAVDTCGTGGDGKKCINVSSAVAIVLSAAGINVVKHGNSAQSGFLGSADILDEFNIPIKLSANSATNYLENNNFVFLFAPFYHPAMKHVANVRKQLGFPTIFNFIGPFINPAEPDLQFTGINKTENLKKLVKALTRAGRKNVIIYSSIDGYDEISTNAPTECYEINSEIKNFRIYPEDFFTPFQMPEVKNKDEAKKLFLKAISGENDKLAKLVSINAMLPVSRIKNKSLKQSFDFCYDLIMSGEVMKKFKLLQNRKV